MASRPRVGNPLGRQCANSVEAGLTKPAQNIILDIIPPHNMPTIVNGRSLSVGTLPTTFRSP